MEAGDLTGEGLKQQDKPPEWLLAVRDIPEQNQIATLDTPEGNVWIIFDKDSGQCTTAVSTKEPLKFRDDFVSDLLKNKNWKRKKNKTSYGLFYQQKVGNIKFRTLFPDTPKESNVFLVDMRAGR